MIKTIADIAEAVRPIMTRYGVRHAQAFGSAARGELRRESDVDILVAFKHPIDGWTFADMADELERALGRPVDLVTENSLSEYVRPHIQADLMPIYGT